MAQSQKSGRVTLEQGGVPDDMPVFVVVAKDATAVELLSEYWRLCELYGSPSDQLEGVRQASAEFMAWQQDHRDEVHVPGGAGRAPRLGSR
jgi:hypothetical protein